MVGAFEGSGAKGEKSRTWSKFMSVASFGGDAETVDEGPELTPVVVEICDLFSIALC